MILFNASEARRLQKDAQTKEAVRLLSEEIMPQIEAEALNFNGCVAVEKPQPDEVCNLVVSELGHLGYEVKMLTTGELCISW